MNLMQLLSKALTVITIFLTENRNYKREFCFKKENLRERLVRYGQIVFGYTYYKNRESQEGGTLQITGLLIEEQLERQT